MHIQTEANDKGSLSLVFESDIFIFCFIGDLPIRLVCTSVGSNTKVFTIRWPNNYRIEDSNPFLGKR